MPDRPLFERRSVQLQSAVLRCVQGGSKVSDEAEGTIMGERLGAAEDIAEALGGVVDGEEG